MENKTKTIKIKENLYENLSIYAKCCMPKGTIDETAERLIQIGIAATQTQLGINHFLKQNPNTD